MNARRTLAFTRRTLMQFRHDRRTFAFVLVMPLLMILIFGYTFGGEVSNVKVEVINQDVGYVADRVINNTNHDTLTITMSTDTVTSKKLVDDGKTWAAIIFPANFTSNLVKYMTFNASATNAANSTNVTNTIAPIRPAVEIYLDGSNPNMAGAVMKAVNTAIINTINDIAREMNRSASEIPINVTANYAYGGENTKFIDYFAPGVISFAIMMVTTMITIILFVFERRNGTLQRLLASPASEVEIVLGYALAFGVIGMIQSIVILSAAILVFNITIAGNILLALFVVMLLAVGHQGLGILLSSWAKNELQAIQFIPLIIFPSVLLAGLFWPIESVPALLRPIGYIIPLKYGIDAERSIMLRGWGIGQIWFEITILVVFALLTLGASVLLLKRRG
ncbi:MAG: ABC transporter permease [Thermoplasmata archaeon]